MYLVPAAVAIVAGMPDDCILVSDFERGGHKDILGHKDHPIDEYALSYAGPSEAFLAIFKLAKDRGIKVMPKLQIGTTHELASVVSLPLLPNICEKARFMRKNDLDGYLGCWNFGSQSSANTMGFNYFLTTSAVGDTESMLKDFCRQIFDNSNADEVVAAWICFCRAMDHYPFSVRFLYFSPLNYTLSHLFLPGPLSMGLIGRSWLPDSRGDDLVSSIAEFSLEEILGGLDKVATLWSEGVALLKSGLAGCSSEIALLELNNASLCGCIFRSAVNSYRLYKLKKGWRGAEDMPEYCRLLSRELDIVEEALPLTLADARQGFHSEGHFYLFSAELLREKLIKGRQLIRRNQ